MVEIRKQEKEEKALRREQVSDYFYYYRKLFLNKLYLFIFVFVLFIMKYEYSYIVQTQIILFNYI